MTVETDLAELRMLVTARFRQSMSVPEKFFAAEEERIAYACWEMARRFHRGGRLLAFGNGASATDAQHVSVEFVHPVIVGKRALPALALTNDAATTSRGQIYRAHDPSTRAHDLSVGSPTPARDLHEVPARDLHEVPARDLHEVPARDLHEVPARDLHEVSAKDSYLPDGTYDTPFVHQINVMARPQDIAMGFTLDGNCTNVIAALETAHRIGLLTLGLGGGDGGLLNKSNVAFPFIVRTADPMVIQETHETLYHVLWELVHIFFEHEGLLTSDTPA